MTKAFLKRVVKEVIVDTKKYRYVCMPSGNIFRIPLVCLDTTETLNRDSWVKVAHLLDIYS